MRTRQFWGSDSRAFINKSNFLNRLLLWLRVGELAATKQMPWRCLFNGGSIVPRCSRHVSGRQRTIQSFEIWGFDSLSVAKLKCINTSKHEAKTCIKTGSWNSKKGYHGYNICWAGAKSRSEHHCYSLDIRTVDVNQHQNSVCKAWYLIYTEHIRTWTGHYNNLSPIKSSLSAPTNLLQVALDGRQSVVLPVPAKHPLLGGGNMAIIKTRVKSHEYSIFTLMIAFFFQTSWKSLVIFDVDWRFVFIYIYICMHSCVMMTCESFGCWDALFIHRQLDLSQLQITTPQPQRLWIRSAQKLS